MILSVYENPKITLKLKEEINSVVKSNDDITVDNIKKLTYLECVINETMRMFNPAFGLF